MLMQMLMLISKCMKEKKKKKSRQLAVNMKQHRGNYKLVCRNRKI